MTFDNNLLRVFDLVGFSSLGVWLNSELGVEVMILFELVPLEILEAIQVQT